MEFCSVNRAYILNMLGKSSNCNEHNINDNTIDENYIQLWSNIFDFYDKFFNQLLQNRQKILKKFKFMLTIDQIMLATKAFHVSDINCNYKNFNSNNQPFIQCMYIC